MASHHQKALQLAREGDWDASHREIQPHHDPLSCLIHGYLHRVEGDLPNAGYWYQRAGESMPDNTLEEEAARLQARCMQQAEAGSP